MNPVVSTFARRSLWALPVWAALLFLSTLTHQPDPQTNFAAFAAYVTTNTFLISHLFGSLGGAAIGSIGAIGLMLYLQNTKAASKAISGMVLTVVGNSLVSAVFGLAAFAQTAMGRMYLAGQQNALDFYNQVYNGTLFIYVAISLLLFMIGGVFNGSAIATYLPLPRWSGWVYAISIVGFVLSGFLFDLGQSIFSALLFIAVTAVAWKANREPQIQATTVGIPARR